MSVLKIDCEFEINESMVFLLVNNLNELKVETVLTKINKELELINQL